MWIANKAAEALNSAKKGITEMAKEMPADTSSEKSSDQNLKTLQRANLLLKRKLDQNTEEISNYKDIIEKMLKEKPDLINFKIIIGGTSEDPSITSSELSKELCTLRDQLESTRSELKQSTQTQNFLLSSLTESQQSFSLLKQSSEVDSKVLKSEIEKLQVQNSDLSLKLSTTESALFTSSDSFNKYKARVQKSISDIFLTLKTSFESLGLALPSVKVEQLGLEDIQEFIFTQCKYYEDSLRAFQGSARSIGKEGKNLDDFRKIFINTLNECKVSLKNSEKSVQESEIKLQKVLREKEDLFKINVKKDKRIEVLIEEIGKNSEEIKICQELKDENPRLMKQVRELMGEIEKMKENLKILKENLEKNEKKVGKKKEKVGKLNFTISNLNKRVKALSQTLTEKEQLINSFQEATSILNSELSELKTTSDQYKSASKKNLEEVTSQFSSKLKESEEKSTCKLKDSEKRIKDLQNEIKDLRVENIQLSNKVKKLEELEKNLGCLSQQNSINLARIDRLTMDKEKTAANLRETEETVKNLKNSLQDAEELLKNRSLFFENEKEGLLLKIRENEHVKREADALLRRIEQETLANEKMIDKRVVSTFLLSYTSDKYSANAKAQMLAALAEMLGMPNNERIRLNPSTESGFFSSFSGYLSRG
jgi:chromosome segregation ATPase